MKERPIPFNGAMVRALLAGNKTQTRRVVRQQPAGAWAAPGKTSCPYGQPSDRLWVREPWRSTADLDRCSGSQIAELCLDAGYNAPWAPIQYEADGARRDWKHTGTPPHDGPPQPGRYRHARFMPRWASRLELEVTGVRVERLQGISYEDALAEGAFDPRLFVGDECRDASVESADELARRLQWPQRSFRELWSSINGAESWDADPWVWIVEFRRI
ncbi:hypothetical protein [Achromobacter xylosoxidans]|uniref:hypothetical protein n=1 Tax=Alcaligenes xylosoxydans xylosoxydans TaxID=85698 RepID=UPI0005D86389|nr:hypothetical protein [Achromobacter xylosoxidans]QKQ52368.1 hypothetical protein FOC83_05025 [Achromobacter xylosoxidans]QPR92751.1 hypothetical protein I6G72_18995 [Achromobacter xylosoxidans]UON42429.1 hypothetical protein IUJ48_10115 [Achromobacter xylosoxidans]CKH67104.1 Uncharacterised protein [Achromobacter xylosoxidans]